VAIKVGDAAPGFTLDGTGERAYSLAEFQGRTVVLVFYPGDDTPVCTKQLHTYTNDLARFDELGAQVLGISSQSVESHLAFAAKAGIGFPLLADPDKEVAAAYGTLGPLGFPRRSVFVIDGDGVIRYAHRAIAGLTFRPTDELVNAVKSANATR
jgi:thioredoxin-dependent peroxiredoxin